MLLAADRYQPVDGERLAEILVNTQRRLHTPGKVQLETDAGVISNLRVSHVVQHVFWRDGDSEGMAATGAFAAALSLSGPAAGMAMMSAEEWMSRSQWSSSGLAISSWQGFSGTGPLTKVNCSSCRHTKRRRKILGYLSS